MKTVNARQFAGERSTPFSPTPVAVIGTAVMLIIATGASAEIPKGDLTIRLEPVVSGLTSPIYLTNAGDGSGRLFIVDQSGPIWIVKDGTLLPTPFLDLTGVIPALNAGFDERGVLGLAFHPNYRHNGRFFVRYSSPRDGDPSEPCFGTSRGCHEEILAEFTVSANPDIANPVGTILFRIDEPEFNHNAGTVAFGPDGLLYFSLGDGGGANDGLNNPDLPHGPIGNGQNINTALGSVLRIDVDGPAPYSIPPDNPFVGTDGLDEIYAYGFRNPYRFSFDDGHGGDGRLLLGDVGQNRFEELDDVIKGGNYGWALREGAHCFDPFDANNPPPMCDSTGLIDPIVDYSREDGGISIIAGFVYRGSRSPHLKGTYIFGDFSASFGSPGGRLYHLVEPEPGEFAIREFRIGIGDIPYGRFLKGFGEDEKGEVYVLGSLSLGPTGDTGVVERIVEDRKPVRQFSALLRGDEEVPPVETDTRGTIKVRFDKDFTQADFDLIVREGIDITQAHFHCAPEGQNGPVVAFLFGLIPGGFDVDDRLARFTMTDANIAAVGADCTASIGMEIDDIADLAHAMREGNIYANVHSVAHPGGEVRGQLRAHGQGGAFSKGDAEGDDR